MSSAIKDFMSAVAKQRHGFWFGPAQRIAEDSPAVVVPILRESRAERSYYLLPEVPEVKICDTGSISSFAIANPTDKHVFLCAGTIFRGPTQERVLLRSTVIQAWQEEKVNVRCIHGSRGISAKAETKYGGVTPLQFDQKTRGDGYAPVDQGGYWNAVRGYTADVAASGLAQIQQSPSWTVVSGSVGSGMISTGVIASGTVISGQMTGSGAVGGLSWLDQLPGRALVNPDQAAINATFGVNFVSVTDGAGTTPENAQTGAKPDDLAAVQDQVASTLDEILRKVEMHPWQVGLAMLNERGLQTLGMFDVHESWKALHGDAVKRLGADLAAKDKTAVSEQQESSAVATVTAALAEEYVETVLFENEAKDGILKLKVSGLTGGKFVGEVVELDGKVIHLVLNRKLGV